MARPDIYFPPPRHPSGAPFTPPLPGRKPTPPSRRPATRDEATAAVIGGAFDPGEPVYTKQTGGIGAASLGFPSASGVPAWLLIGGAGLLVYLLVRRR